MPEINIGFHTTQEAQLLLGMADRTGSRKTVIPSGTNLAAILGVGQLS